MEPSYSAVVQALAGPQPGIVKVEANVAEPVEKVREDLCTLEAVLDRAMDDGLKEKVILALKEQFTEVCQKESDGKVNPTGFVLIWEEGKIYLQLGSPAEMVAVKAIQSVRVAVRTFVDGYVLVKRYTVSFEHTQAIREVYQKIEMMEARIKEIEAEYKDMELTGYSQGKPRLATHIMGKEDFGNFLGDMEKKRKRGEDLNHLEMHKLKFYKAMDTAPINARIDKLWAEQQDLWIALRQEQMRLV
jgi:hypothetical protein